jgi:hypothetical protein
VDTYAIVGSQFAMAERLRDRPPMSAVASSTRPSISDELGGVVHEVGVRFHVLPDLVPVITALCPADGSVYTRRAQGTVQTLLTVLVGPELEDECSGQRLLHTPTLVLRSGSDPELG